MGGELVTAREMAEAADISPKSFRRKLREAQFAWHAHGARWTVEKGGPEHKGMMGVLAGMQRAS